MTENTMLIIFLMVKTRLRVRAVDIELRRWTPETQKYLNVS